jgi:hypothetical protein
VSRCEAMLMSGVGFVYIGILKSSLPELLCPTYHFTTIGLFNTKQDGV